MYEYANQLVSRGHQVDVVHPRRLCYLPPSNNVSIRDRIRIARWDLQALVSDPDLSWQKVDPRVRLTFVPNSDPKHIGDGDVLFATAWNTVPSVLRCSRSKGQKCYLIQHYETWMGPKHLVDETWLAPLHKVVVSQWLLEVGTSLGAQDLTQISNGIDHEKYRLIRSIESRPRRVVMMCSSVPFKACQDGIKALEIAKREFPDLAVVLFGSGRRPSWVPRWMPFWRNPPQSRIIEDFYNNSSIVLSSSLAEGFALPPAEAAACGCAIVASDSGGIRDFVEHGYTGLLSPPRDPEALASNLCLMLSNDNLRVRLAAAAKSFVAQLGWKRCADRLEEFLGRVVRQDTPLDCDPMCARAVSFPATNGEGRNA